MSNCSYKLNDDRFADYRHWISTCGHKIKEACNWKFCPFCGRVIIFEQRIIRRL